MHTLVRQRFGGEQQFKQLNRVYRTSLLASLPSFNFRYKVEGLTSNKAAALGMLLYMLV